jgi:hypothetical protein
MDMAGPSACTECEAASQKISELTDERNVLEAQRDHYSARCDELTTELGLAREQLNEKFKISDCSSNDSSLFDSESVERLREWQKCLAFCIEERLEKEERTTKSSKLEDREREGEGELKVQEPGLSRRGEGLKTVLPFSPGNLTGFLTKNHQLTQKYTEYPEPKQRKPQTGKSHGEPTTFAKQDIA